MILSLLIITILSILSLIFLVTVLVLDAGYIFYLLYVLITYFPIRYIYREKLKAYRGIPIYIYIFMPGLGPMLLLFILIPLYYFKKDSLLIEDYETYIRFKSQLDRERSFDYEESLQTMSAMDFMHYFSPDAKKTLIIEKLKDDSTNTIEVLKAANEDIDPEVQHYAAVMLNEIENNFNKKIHDLKQKLKKKSTLKVLDALIHVYKEYIHSGLINGSALELYNNEYIRLLNRRDQISGLEKDQMVELMAAYIRQLNKIQSMNVFKRAVEVYPKTVEFYLLKLKLDLTLKNHSIVKEDLKTLKRFRREDIQSKQLRSQVDFWCQQPIEELL